MVVLLYPDISNFTFQNVKNLKYEKFLIDFFDELANFKQKNLHLKCIFFLHFTTTDPMYYLVISDTKHSCYNQEIRACY